MEGGAMAEVLTTFTTPVRDQFGEYFARAVGRPAADHRWEAWIEFVPADGGGDVLVGPIESRQPERVHLAYWATGLTHVYLEGALARARHPITVRVPVIDEPFSDHPAARRVVMQRTIPKPEPVLDPFSIGEHSIDILRQELSALNRPRLLNVIAAYDLGVASETAHLSDAQLVGLIVAAVARTLSAR
jgi:hypothetical protein